MHGLVARLLAQWRRRYAFSLLHEIFAVARVKRLHLFMLTQIPLLVNGIKRMDIYQIL